MRQRAALHLHRSFGADITLLLALWAQVLLGSIAAAQTLPTAFSGPYERESIRAGTATTQDASGSSTVIARKSTGLIDPQRVILALAIVLGIIFGLRWIGRRYFPAIAGGKLPGAVKVLSRTPIASKQHILLLQVGRRVLVLSDNGAQLSALSEISEPDEVAQLLGQISNTSHTGVFDSAFGKAQDDFDDVVPHSIPMPNDGNATPMGVEIDETEEQKSLASTEGDIKGLMDKVRGLAEQLGRSS